MIEAKDLSIGNWYNLENPMEGGKLYQSQFTIWTDYLDFEGYGQSIPLTPEILEKCGFIFSEDTQFGEKKVYGVLGNFYFSSNGIMWNGFILEHIKFLHQFQNLYYALTGTELEIKL